MSEYCINCKKLADEVARLADGINSYHVDLEKVEAELFRTEAEADLLRGEVAQLTGVIDELVNVYVCNRGTEQAFIMSYTTEGIPTYWRNAMEVLDGGK